MSKIIWKSILSGFLYELFYQLALALRWLTTEESFSFIVAAFIGIIIALIIRQSDALRTFLATLAGLASAFVFHIIVVNLNIPLKILFHLNPLIKDIGHTTVNESITISFVTLGYLSISLVTFLVAIRIISLVTRNKN